jgi:hypothetical protein
MLEQFLQIVDEAVTTDLNIKREVEYDMSEAQVRDLLLTGSLDAFLDALDFAPIGVIDLIKVLAVKLPLTDLNKRKALAEKTGFDVDRALQHIEEERLEEQAGHITPPTQERRVKKEEGPTRRTTTNYKVVNKQSTT